jgi:hypothetical protein
VDRRERSLSDAARRLPHDRDVPRPAWRSTPGASS